MLLTPSIISIGIGRTRLDYYNIEGNLNGSRWYVRKYNQQGHQIQELGPFFFKRIAKRRLWLWFQMNDVIHRIDS